MEYLVKTGQDINSYTEKLKYGDVVRVESGEYGGKILLKVPGVTYVALEKHKAIINGQIYFVNGASYVTVDGFKNIGSESIDMEADNADYNKILNCFLKGDGRGNGGGIGYSGIGHIYEGNEICYGGHGLHPGGVGEPIGTLIKNNIIHDCIGHGIAAVGGKDEKAVGNIVYNCRRSASGGGTGIFFATVNPENVLVDGNLVWGCESNEIAVEGTNATIINNTAVGTNPDLDKVFNLMGSGFVVRNNIGYRRGAGKRVLLISRSAITDYNCWFNPDEPKCISRYFDVMTLEQYKTYGQGLHSISLDPKFVDIANEDFHLQADSPCKNTGEGGIDMGYPYEIQPEPKPPEPEPEEEKMWDVAGIDFVATFKKGSITGKITKDGIGLESVWLDLTGEVASTTQTDDGGSYLFSGLPNGVYTITPKSEIYIFEPESINVSIPTT